jgi:hypothetical protein
LHALQHARLNPDGDDDEPPSETEDVAAETRELLTKAYFDETGRIEASFHDGHFRLIIKDGWQEEDDSEKRWVRAFEELLRDGLLKLAAGVFKGNFSYSAVRTLDPYSPPTPNQATFEITQMGKHVAAKLVEKDEADLANGL